MFIGRTNELNEIVDGLKTDRFESFLIYGRRRVGKTELINEGIKHSDAIIVSYECIKSTIKDNLVLFTNKLKNIFNDNYIHFDSFNELFTYVFNKSLTQNILLFIDEFSFLLEEDFSIESSLAVIIDRYKSKTKMKLFISGSYVSLIEKMIEYGSHSYGRYTHIMLIRPFDYYDSSLFYKDYSDEDKIMLYSVFGGIPYFNSLIDTNKSALDNILNLVVKRDSILEHEINEMVLAETNKITNMNVVVSLIARGINKYKDIYDNLSSMGISKPDYLLKKLLEMDIIKKVFPINEENNKKKVFYQFKDNLLNFYYRFIFYTPYQEFRTNPKFFYDNFIKEEFEKEYLPKLFEMISMEYLFRANINSLIKPIILKIGKYSFNDSQNKINREFDVVTLDKNGYVSYECKYTNSKIDSRIIVEEENQTKNLSINFYKLGFISKSGFSDDIDKKKYNCFNLNDFYKE